MRHVREALRLAASGASRRRIAECVGVARSTVGQVLDRAAAAGLTWPLPDALNDEALSAALFKRAGVSPNLGVRRRQEPDWAALHLEMKRPHVTLMLLWEEHRIAAGDRAYGYSRFCELYRTFEAGMSPSMRQTHAAGDKMFVDYAGATVPVLVDALTGEMRAAQRS
jgi:transposase